MFGDQGGARLFPCGIPRRRSRAQSKQQMVEVERHGCERGLEAAARAEAASKGVDVTTVVEENRQVILAASATAVKRVLVHKSITNAESVLIRQFVSDTAPVESKILERGFDYTRQRFQLQIGVARQRFGRGMAPVKELNNAAYLAGLDNMDISTAIKMLRLLGQSMGVELSNMATFGLHWRAGNQARASIVNDLWRRPYYASYSILRSQRIQKNMTTAIHLDPLIDPDLKGSVEEKETMKQLVQSIKNWDKHPVVLVVRSSGDSQDVRESVVGKLKQLAREQNIEAQLELYLDLENALNPEIAAYPAKGVLVVEQPGLLDLNTVLVDSFKQRGLKEAAAYAAANPLVLGLFTALPKEVKSSDWVHVFMILTGMKVVPYLQLEMREAEMAKIFSTHA